VVEWAELEALIDRCDVAGVAAAVRGLPPQQCRALTGPLKELDRWTRAGWVSGPQPGLAVAGAAVLPGAAALAAWLARNDPDSWDPVSEREVDATQAVLGVLRDRGVSWLPELTRLLAGRLSASRGMTSLWPLVKALVAETGIEPPTTDGFVVRWAEDYWPEGHGVVGEIRRDPRLAALIPRLFEIGVTAAQFDSGDAGQGWPAVLTALAAEGLVGRETLIDCCLAALQRGGRLGAVRGLLRVHDALSPDPAEVSARARDYLTLLNGTHSMVAGMAQRQLRRQHEAGLLGLDLLYEASDALLLRPEKTLVRAQLDWLDQAAARDASHAGELALAMATAFSQPAADLQARALTLVLKHRSVLGISSAEQIAAAAAALPPDLRARADQALGQVLPASVTGAPSSASHGLAPQPEPPGQEAAGQAVPAPDALRSTAMPPPIGSAEELVAEFSALYLQSASYDPINLERVLAGIVTLSHADRPGLTAVLRPLLLDRMPWVDIGQGFHIAYHSLGESFWETSSGLDMIIGAVVAPDHALARPGYPRHPDPDGNSGGRLWQQYLVHTKLPGPQAGLIARLHEIAVGVGYAPRPLLVSTPSTSTGLIDPVELVGRLRRAAQEGWQPWRIDLAQALLRLPRDPEPDAAASAASLGTPAGTLLSRRLSAGAPADPGVTVSIRTARWRDYSYTSSGFTEATQDRLVATVQSSPRSGSGDPCDLVGDLPEPERSTVGWFHQTELISCWPMMLPAHRDVIAAHLVPHLLARVASGSGMAVALPGLAAADGPAGPGMHLALGYALAAHGLGDRAAAVDALITLAARGQLDGAAFGTQLGVLAARRLVPLNRVVPGLRDVAVAGAQAQVWELIAAMLPQILPPAASPPPRTADLIALGVEIAQAIHPAATLAWLDQLAARRGSSQLIVQARRLRQALAVG
jgi:hypothetical protein